MHRLRTIFDIEVVFELLQNLLLSPLYCVDYDVYLVIEQLNLVEATFNPLMQRSQLHPCIPSALIHQVDL